MRRPTAPNTENNNRFIHKGIIENRTIIAKGTNQIIAAFYVCVASCVTHSVQSANTIRVVASVSNGRRARRSLEHFNRCFHFQKINSDCSCVESVVDDIVCI